MDSFDAPAARVPTSVGRISLTLVVVDGTPNTYESEYEFVILDQYGDEMYPIRSGKAIPYLVPGALVGLSVAEFNGLQGIMDKLLVAAQSTVS